MKQQDEKKTAFALDESSHVVDVRITEKWDLIKKSLNGEGKKIIGWSEINDEEQK